MAREAHADLRVEPRLIWRPDRASARLGGAAWDFARRKPVGAFAALIVVAVLAIGILADQVAPHDAYTTSPIDSLRAPDGNHLLGTDLQGRDVLSRVIHGTRISVGVGFGAVLLGVSVGTLIGLVSGYFGGMLDTLLQRGIDILLAFPTLILAMAIVAAAGTGSSAGLPGHHAFPGSLMAIGVAVKNNRNLILAIGITLIPGATRLVRGAVLSVKENQYVEAARALGATNVRLMWSHILPNVFAPILVLLSVVVGQAIIAEASLSFLGLGAQPPSPSWGGMLSGSAQRYIEQAPWLVIFPGVAIAVVVYAFNMFGDALRDVLDPRLRGS